MKCIFWRGWYRVCGGEGAVERLPPLWVNPRAHKGWVVHSPGRSVYPLQQKWGDKVSPPMAKLVSSKNHSLEASAPSCSFHRRHQHHHLQLGGQRGRHGGECNARPPSLLSHATGRRGSCTPSSLGCLSLSSRHAQSQAFSLPSIGQRLACIFLFPLGCSQVTGPLGHPKSSPPGLGPLPVSPGILEQPGSSLAGSKPHLDLL